MADTNLFKCLSRVMVPYSGIVSCDLDIDVFRSCLCYPSAKNVADTFVSIEILCFQFVFFENNSDLSKVSNV